MEDNINTICETTIAKTQVNCSRKTAFENILKLPSNHDGIVVDSSKEAPLWEFSPSVRFNVDKVLLSFDLC